MDRAGVIYSAQACTQLNSSSWWNRDGHTYQSSIRSYSYSVFLAFCHPESILAPRCWQTLQIATCHHSIAKSTSEVWSYWRSYVCSFREAFGEPSGWTLMSSGSSWRENDDRCCCCCCCIQWRSRGCKSKKKKKKDRKCSTVSVTLEIPFLCCICNI